MRVRIREGVRPVPLVLCNGIGAGMEALDRLVDAIDPEVTVVRLDMPGLGGSPAPALPYTIPQAAQLVHQLMAGYLGHTRYDALGYSWGGLVVQQLAARQHAVRRIVLICSNTGVLTVPGRPDSMATLISPPALDPDTAHVFAGRMFGGAAADPALLTPQFQQTLIPATSSGYTCQLMAAGSWTSLPFLWTIRQPALVLAGDDDPVVPVANARLIGRLTPRSQVHVFSGGHLDPLIRPECVAGPVNAFLG